jgi:hypothetical protein
MDRGTRFPDKMRRNRGAEMKIGMAHALLVLAAACPLAPAVGQVPTRDVTALLEGELTAELQESCRGELAQHCAEVTPGQGRILACLYANGDKLSGRCELALYDAAARLERAISAVTYVASECRAELERHCGDVVAGEGRVTRCLKDHAGELSPRCGQAMTKLGVE